MINRSEIKIERLLLVIIILTATFLRFWDYTEIPFMHDEFSAIFRARFDTIGEVIKKGILPDAHPPGVQLFIWLLIKLFGVSEPVLKFPFLFLGVGSVIFAYLVTKQWFGENAALLTSAFIAVTQYNVFYSQIIRPYEPGLFFSLGTAYFWTKMAVQNNFSLKNKIWFILFFTINGYIHAFTIFFNLLLWITGLFLLKRKKIKEYFKISLISLILLIPSLLIFLFQLKRGDIGGWLGKPTPDFIIEYFKYIFHFSKFYFSVVVFAAAYVAYKNRFKLQNPKGLVIFISWFLITFLTAYLYSVLRIPVIQYSTLYFVFPFLIMTLFSFSGNSNIKITAIAVIAILFTGTSTLVTDRRHYDLMYHQGLNEIPALVINDLKYYDEPAIVLQSPQTKMFDYYFKKYGKTPNYYRLENSKQLKRAVNYINNKKYSNLIIGITGYRPFTFLETAKTKFPYVVKMKTSANMEYWLLSKQKINNAIPADSLETVVFNEKEFVMKSNEKYKGGITVKIKDINHAEYDVLNVKACIYTDSVIPDAYLVTDWRLNDTMGIDWRSAKLSDFYSEKDSVYYPVISVRLMNFKTFPEQSYFKFYIWKKDRSKIKAKNIKVYKTKMDPVEFGLFKKIY